MTTNRKSQAQAMLEKLNGGPFSLGQLLEGCRAPFDMSLPELAERSGVPLAILTRVENGDSMAISVPQLRAVAEALSYSTKILIRARYNDELRDAGENTRVEVGDIADRQAS